MTPTLHLVACAALLTWLCIMVASLVRAKSWTPKGMLFAFSNRDNPEPPSAFAQRTDRMANNTLENFILFAALALAGNAAGTNPHQVETGATVYLWARVVYIPVYMIGIPYLRTAVWGVGAFGMGMILVTLL